MSKMCVAHVALGFKARDAPDLADNIRHAFGLVHDHVGGVLQRLVAVQLAREHFRVRDDTGQRLIEFVSSGAGKLSDGHALFVGLYFVLGVFELGAHAKFIANVGEHADRAYRTILVVDQCRGDAHGYQPVL